MYVALSPPSLSLPPASLSLSLFLSHSDSLTHPLCATCTACTDFLIFILICILIYTHLQSQALPQIVGLCRAADSQARYIWLGILLAYKGIFLIVGLFLAFETRKVKIRQLNDSKLIGMSVYGIVVLSVALAAIGIFLEAMVSIFYIVTGLMILIGNTCLLCLIFIPKVQVYERNVYIILYCILIPYGG